MNEPVWERVAALFEAVVDLPAAERAEVLARECAGDEALRVEVESLVTASSRDRDPLRTAIGVEAPRSRSRSTRSSASASGPTGSSA